jgi:energy-coupling factor transport system ATP-binding protein
VSIEVDKISFRYDKKEPLVLDGFSACFPSAGITALTGRNGSGKTTLSRIIMGILKPETGTVTVDGEDTGDLSLAEMGRRIGYVMQNPARQIFSTSVREEMLYGLQNTGLSGDEAEERMRDYLARFELSGREDDFPFYLSQGEKQRLVLAAVLAMRPGWLMLDEPTASLDYERRRQLGEQLLRVRDELSCSVIIISHDRDFVDSYADGVVVMEGGILG